MIEAVLISRDTVADLMLCAVGEVDGDGEWELVANEFLGEWRWGYQYLLVAKRVGEPGFWAWSYRYSAGDSDYCSLDDEGLLVEFYNVVPKIVTSIEFVRPEAA